jgi:hypothetical protein
LIRIDAPENGCFDLIEPLEDAAPGVDVGVHPLGRREDGAKIVESV